MKLFETNECVPSNRMKSAELCVDMSIHYAYTFICVYLRHTIIISRSIFFEMGSEN